MKEEVESVKISIVFLHFESFVICKTDEEVKRLCTVLGLAKAWRVYRLHLNGYKIGAEGWEALSKVADKGKANRVNVSKSALRAANNQQVEALWRATSEFWRDDHSGRKIAEKSEGDTGLQKLLAHRRQETQIIPQNQTTGQLTNKSVGDDADQEKLLASRVQETQTLHRTMSQNQTADRSSRNCQLV